MSTDLLLYKGALLVYLTATVLYLADAIRRRPQARLPARLTLLAGFLLHSATLLSRYLALGYTPAVNLHQSITFFAWAVSGVFLLYQLRYRQAVLGVFIAGLVCALLSLGALFDPGLGRQLPPVLDHWLFPMHVVLAFLGNAVFALAFGAGVMYLVQERMLKSKSFNALYYRLPSLDSLDRINYACLTFGFPLLTLGMISGSVWAGIAWGSYWSWEPKQTWGLVTWLLYAALLHARLTVGWRGRRAAILAIVGFLALMFSFLGVNLLMEGSHSFDTFKGQ